MEPALSLVGWAQCAEVEVARAPVLGIVHERPQAREHALIVGALGPMPGQHLGELGPDQIGGVDPEQIPRPAVGRLHPAVGADQKHPVGSRVEDLRESVLLELHLLVVASVVHRDGGVSGQARE